MKEAVSKKSFDWSICVPHTNESRTTYHKTTFAALLWGIAFVLGTAALHNGWLPPGVLSLVPGIVCLLLGVYLIASYIRFFRAMDELFQKIQTEALALGFGGGLIVIFAYRLLERAGAPALDISDAGLFMLACWIAGMIIAVRKYS